MPSLVRGVGRSARLGGEDDAPGEHVKMGIDLNFYGGPGGEALESFRFVNKALA